MEISSDNSTACTTIFSISRGGIVTRCNDPKNIINVKIAAAAPGGAQTRGSREAMGRYKAQPEGRTRRFPAGWWCAGSATALVARPARFAGRVCRRAAIVASCVTRGKQISVGSAGPSRPSPFRPLIRLCGRRDHPAPELGLRLRPWGGESREGRQCFLCLYAGSDHHPGRRFLSPEPPPGLEHAAEASPALPRPLCLAQRLGLLPG
jgi:hypothetical protein